MVRPIRGIKDGLREDEDDRAHIIDRAKPQIEFLHASEGYRYLEGKILKQEEGVTYGLFKEDVNHGSNPTVVDAEPATGFAKHIFVPEVVKEKRMHYYQVPRLGSYLAVKLEYQSCLFEEAYDAAVENYKEVNQLNQDQEAERQQWEEEQAELKREKLEAGEEFEPEDREWTPHSFSPFRTTKVQFVLCLNTMGQDREFTAEEKACALKCVKHYQDSWEAREKKNLEHDVVAKINSMEYDRLYKEHFEAQDAAELDKQIEEAIIRANNAKAAEGEDELTDAEKDTLTKEQRFRAITQGFYAPDQAAEYRARQDKPGSTGMSGVMSS